jgi:hypothetical protein
MRLLRGKTLRSAATVPGRDHLPDAPVPSTEYAVAMKYLIVGRRFLLDEAGDAHAEVRSAEEINTADSILNMAVPPAN